MSDLETLKQQYIQMREMRKTFEQEGQMECNQCGNIKNKENFSYRNKKLEIRRKICKECVKEYNKNRYIKNSETLKLNAYIKYHQKKNN